jgi:hypothetical protein
VRDLLSYSQYMAGRAALRAGATVDAAGYFDAAVMSVRQVLKERPAYLGGYVELAVYECARNEPGAAVAAVRSRARALASGARGVREPRRRNSAELRHAAAAADCTVGRRIRTRCGASEWNSPGRAGRHRPASCSDAELLANRILGQIVALDRWTTEPVA